VAAGGEGVGAVAAHCHALIDAVAQAAVGVKFQLASFERFGAGGWQLLDELAAHASALGLLVLLDGKRGDVPHTAAAYAAAQLARDGLAVDGVTVNPLFGSESLEPFLELAAARGAGVFVVVRSSNPGGAQLQELELAEGGRLWERIAQLVGGFQHPDRLGDVGAVVGATATAALGRARALLGPAPLLVPGVGAQGGGVEGLAGCLADLPEPWRRASLLVTAARSIERAHLQRGGPPAAAAAAEAEALRARLWALG